MSIIPTSPNPRRWPFSDQQDEDLIGDEFGEQRAVDYSQYQIDTRALQNEFLRQGYQDEGYQVEGSQILADAEQPMDEGDRLIGEKAAETLNNDPDIDASDIKIKVKKGTVLLSGTVQSRDDRFRAEMAIETIGGVENIVNIIKLRRIGYKH